MMLEKLKAHATAPGLLYNYAVICFVIQHNMISPDQSREIMALL